MLDYIARGHVALGEAAFDWLNLKSGGVAAPHQCVEDAATN
jgi:hypothetical protein